MLLTRLQVHKHKAVSDANVDDTDVHDANDYDATIASNPQPESSSYQATALRLWSRTPRPPD